MRPRQPLPAIWLVTDERQGETLWPALDQLPRGSGIVFRHYRTPPPERRRLFERIRRIALARHLTLVLADSPQRASAWRADGVHGRSKRRAGRPMLRTTPAHGRRELLAALSTRADLIFLSPVFPTRSHPAGRTLGVVRFGMAARGAPRVVALGGMDEARGRRLAALGSYGWAAIDAFGEGGRLRT